MLDIITIADGEIITKPGLYRMSLEWYHNVKVCGDEPCFSSSGLRTVFSKSAHAFWKTSDLNPNRYPKKESAASLVLGSATHCLVLGDEVYDEQYITVPTDAPRRPTSTQIAAFERDGEWSEKALVGATFWEVFDKKAASRKLLTEEQIQKIIYMSENIADCPEAVEALTSEYVEISMFWIDPQTGLWLRSRMDNLPTNGYDYADLKTFAPKSSNLDLAAMRSITDYRYDMQFGLAIEGAEALGIGSAEECIIVFVQTSEPYEVLTKNIEIDTLYWARVCNRQAINTIAECLKTGVWPMAAQSTTPYSLPPSLTAKYADMQSDGSLPSL